MKKSEIDMTEGKMLGKILAFSIPLMITGIVQVLFNAADTAIVGRFSDEGQLALAAVGSTGSITNILATLFIGLSQGATILASRYFGADNKEKMHRTVHTASLVGLIGGIIIGAVGIIFTIPLLRIFNVPEEIIPMAALYLRIIFLGRPASMFYYFLSGIMRAYGDTKKPMNFLMIAGGLNVILNLLFVIIFKMSVAGVAIATLISETLSAFLALTALTKIDNGCRLCIRKLRIYKKELKEIVSVGLPAGIQYMVVSFSGAIIASAFNSFGSAVIAAGSIVDSIFGFVCNSMSALCLSTTTVCSQNYGAQNKKRILKGYLICMTLLASVGIILGMSALIFKYPLIKIFTTDGEVIKAAVMRLNILMPFAFLCGTLDVSGNALRGIGKSVIPAVISLFGSCGVIILWRYTVFLLFPTFECLSFAQPISYLVTTILQTVFFIVYYRKMKF